MTSKQLQSYAALAAGFLAFSHDSDAQVWYRDFDPDSVIQTTVAGIVYTSLDLDFDGNEDFFIRAQKGGLGSRVKIGNLNPNEILMTSAINPSFAVPMTSGQVVASSTVGWKNIFGATMRSKIETPSYYYTGGFFTADTASIGVRVLIDSEFHYGFVRVRNTTFNGTMLIDHMLNAVPNEPLAIATPAPAECTQPLNLNSVSASGSATLDWDDVPTAVKYQVKGKPATSTAEFNFRKSNFSMLNVPVNPGTTYLWSARALCADGGVSPFAPLQSFSALAPLRNEEQLGQFFEPVKFKPVKREVFDLSGRLVLIRETCDSPVFLDAALSTGVYIVKDSDVYGNFQLSRVFQE